MREPLVARELNLPSVGWLQISASIASDPAIQDIQDAALLLPALGLMIAATGSCIAKDDDFISQSEMYRTVMPGSSPDVIDRAVEALQSVGLLIETAEDGRKGWLVGCKTLLQLKKKRVGDAQNAANRRWGGRTSSSSTSPQTHQEEAAEEIDDPLELADTGEVPF